MKETKNMEKIYKIRHSLAHLMAIVVLEMFPDTKLTIGPVIDNGFYYDFDLPGGVSISSDNFKKIEKEIKKLINKKIDFIHEEISENEARKIFKDNPYKLELIDEITKEGEKISVYKNDDFIDLCAGPHVKNTSELNTAAFAITRTAGAYWRGNEENKMLTRVYGVAFEDKEKLDGYFKIQEEAKARDHRKLGKELDLFTFSPLVGAGLPMFTPKGTIIRTELQNALLKISSKYGMMPVTIPHIAKRELYETSGHAQKFGDELIKVIGHYDEFVMKPVNCPHHTQIYASRPRSYRDLPLRYMESTMMYRDEKPGELSGLTRVRAITVDDGHIFCSIDQIKEEAKNIAKIIEEFYTSIGMFDDHWVSLSVRDPKNHDAYIGEEKDWNMSEDMLQDISNELNLNAKKIEGEAAIYGPKLDYMFKDSLGRETQLATIQIDFAMPKRFGLVYIDNEGKERTPVMIHRAILGSYERFMAILIEHFAGAFPFWLSPVQVKILPISETHKKYAFSICENLKKNNIRVEVDSSDETLGKKIRNAKLEKVPYYFVVGDAEVENKTITVESRDDGKIGEQTIEEFKDNIEK
jgi:threonyl-tRNA synthetase